MYIVHLVSIQLASWKRIGKEGLDKISRYMKDKVIRSSQHEFTKGKSSVTNLDKLL